ncbi:MAG: hypothetical protein IT376_14425 [Polyangiaceae bacterium]|nr:hypothetical protein [Polyangiaceae bacterium]
MERRAARSVDLRARAGRALAGLAGAALAWGVSGAAWASPAEQFGFGPRSQALGATGAAAAEGFEATYANPARLSASRKRELTLGWQIFDFELAAEGENAPGEQSGEALRGTYIGAVFPVPFGGVLRDRISLGLGAFTPRTLIVRARLLYPERPQFPLLADRAQTLSLNLGLGADLGWGIRVGGGVLALAELVGTAVVRTDASGRVGTVVDDQLIASYAAVAGVSYERGAWLAGITWRDELVAEFDVLVQVFDLGALVIPDLHISGVAQYDPEQLAAEIGWRGGGWLVTGGVTYKRWGAFPGWAEATVRCPSDYPSCTALRPVPVGFHDTWVPRVGVEWALPLAAGATGRVRAGYFYEPSPVPEQKGASNYYDPDRHVLTAGYGVRLEEPLPPVDVSLFYQEHLGVPRTHVKEASIACDPAAPDCSVNAGFPSVETRAGARGAGVTFGVRF